jgi:hypothetical protein
VRIEYGAGAVLAVAFAMASCGGDSTGRISGAEQSRLCAMSRHADEQLVREYPDVSAAELAASTEKACANGFHEVPVGAPRIAVSSAGCKPWDDEPATPISHRRVAAPDPRTPYFAPRAGRLPSNGTPKVAGIQLPKGSRCPHYWAADGPSPDALELARRLAAAFPQTGLWPVIWDWEDDPDSYAVTQGDPRAADRLDGADVLRRLWKTYRGDGTPFPGIASGSRKPGAAPVDAFGTLAISKVLQSPADAGWVLILVPVNRPADAITMLGVAETEIMSDARLTAVARSWEERFGAVLASVGPGGLGFAVSDAPRSAKQALALAAEQNVFSPDNAESDEAGLAQTLLNGAPGQADTGWKGFWDFGWPD